MTIRNLERLLAPRSIALVGASPEPGSVGRIIAANLAAGGFSGEIWLVNPRHSSIDGRPCYASVAALPRPPDLAVIATPPATVPSLVAELARAGTLATVIITAGIDPDLRRQMLDAGREACLRVLGPNCIGIMLPKLGVNASFSHRMPLVGDLAFLSQSGALVTAMIDWAHARGIGFSHVISMGDMADVDFGDLLDYLAGDTHSRAILLYVEQIVAAPKFMSAARRAARAKPVIVLKSGRHAAGAKAARSHTGALSGSDAVYEAAFRRAGLLRVPDLDDLFQAAEILSFAPRLEGDRLAILTNGGGAGVLAADRLADFRGQLASLSPATVQRLDAALPATWSKGNPVDIIGDAGPDRYRAALEVLLEDAQSDAILVINCPTALASSEEAARCVIETIGARKDAGAHVKPVITNWLGDGAAAAARQLFSKARLPTFETPAAAIEGFMQLVDYRRSQDELMQAPRSVSRELHFDQEPAVRVMETALSAGRDMLTELEAKSVLECYGIPSAMTVKAANPDEVAAHAVKILERNRACVIKILSDDISHKSDVDGVHLGLTTTEEARLAAVAMLATVQARLPDARIDGFTVEPMIQRPDAQELIVGMSVDATFGPTMIFGAGGTAVEVIKDTAHALPPLDVKLARQLISQTRIYRLLQGYRNQPAADLDALADVLVRVSYLVTDNPQIRELDINPLLADAEGCIALDARIRVADNTRSPRQPLAIRPYPAEWETSAALPGVGDMRIRPVRPEDERLYEDFFRRVTAEDIRMRFFTAGTERSHRFLARLTQIDYAREMAFVALAAAGGELLGVVRLMAEPDGKRAEYAVLVRSDIKGRGLGWVLMQHLIAYAHAEGIEELFGDVLATNTTMIKMCGELGFEVKPNPDDAMLRRVALTLS